MIFEHIEALKAHVDALPVHAVPIATHLIHMPTFMKPLPPVTWFTLLQALTDRSPMKNTDAPPIAGLIVRLRIIHTADLRADSRAPLERDTWNEIDEMGCRPLAMTIIDWFDQIPATPAKVAVLH